MNEKELFQRFLNNHPESFHQSAFELFLEYAIAACKNGNEFGEEERNQFRTKGLSEDCIDYYLDAFGWIERTYNHLLP